MDTTLLEKLCSIHGPSGEEAAVRDFLIKYVTDNAHTWVQKPKMGYGEGFQDCLILEFGKPRTALFVHMDTTGFTVRYENQLIPIGGPSGVSGDLLVGEDALGTIECKLKIDKEGRHFHNFPRAIERGTSLTYKPNFIRHKENIISPYLDNRLGIFMALQIASTLKDGAIVFTSWEEHGGGSVPYLIRYLYDKHKLVNGLICDVTWVTEGVHSGQGGVVSLRDRNIPRKAFLRKLFSILDRESLPYQLEVEAGGSSDGRELQTSPYPIDWCFLGVAQEGPHSSEEKINMTDVGSLIAIINTLFRTL